MKTLLISPHLDDAVLSAGQFLANQPGCDVLTVFAGVPDWSRNIVTPYDAKCGFQSSRRAMEARRLEDRDALARLNCEPMYWDYLDSQYGELPAVDEVADHVVTFVAEGEYQLVLSCLGLMHPDHELVSDAVIRAASSLTAQVYLWEGLPNRVLYPETVPERLAYVRAHGLRPSLDVPGGAGPLADKVRALLCYRSQLGTGDLDFNLLCVPERFWRLDGGDDA